LRSRIKRGWFTDLKQERDQQMQRCTTCNQTYPDDAPGFCPHDGARLVRDDASSFDPQKTVMGTTPPSGDLAPPQPQQPFYNQPPPQWTPPPPQAQGWPPPQQQQQAPPAQNWGGYQQQQPPPPGQYPPYGMPYPLAAGRRKILGILSIVFGGLTALLLLLLLTEAIERKYFYYSGSSGYPPYSYRRDGYQVMAVIVTVLGAAALVLGIIGLMKALKDPARFGGKELAIAGMGVGVVGAIVALVSAFS
jgi:hypothetical protein